MLTWLIILAGVFFLGYLVWSFNRIGNRPRPIAQDQRAYFDYLPTSPAPAAPAQPPPAAAPAVPESDPAALELERQKQARREERRREWEREREEGKAVEAAARLMAEATINCDFPDWLVILAETRKIEVTHANLLALRAWLDLVFAHANRRYQGRLPINKLWLDLRDYPEAPFPQVTGFYFFVNLSRVLVKAGILLANRGGAAYKLVDDAPARLHKLAIIPLNVEH